MYLTDPNSLRKILLFGLVTTFCNNHLVTRDVTFAQLLCSNLPAPCHLDMGASLAVPPAAAAAGRLTIGHPCSDLLARFAQALVWFSLLPRPRGHLSELSRRLPPYCYMVLYCVIWFYTNVWCYMVLCDVICGLGPMYGLLWNKNTNKPENVKSPKGQISGKSL